MLIRCPKCRVCYRIKEEIVPERGRRFRCMKCGEIWQAVPADLFEETAENASEVYQPETGKTEKKEEAEKPAPAEPRADSEKTNAAEPADEEEKNAPSAGEPEIKPEDLAAESSMQEIFSRLDKQSELLAAEDKKIAPAVKALMRAKRALGLDNAATRRTLSLTLLAVFVLSLFSFRYEIVRKLPWAEKLYTMVGVESVILGEGLEFQNISRREYEEDYIRKMEIKGFIVNNSSKELKVPTIYVEVLSKDAVMLQHQNIRPPVESIQGGKRAAFNVIIVQPSPLSKHILLTFTKDKTE